jgi:hypothetical protein
MTIDRLLDLWNGSNEPSWTASTAANQKSRIALTKADPIAKVLLVRLAAVAGGRWPVAGGRWPVAGGRWPVAGGPPDYFGPIPVKDRSGTSTRTCEPQSPGPVAVKGGLVASLT